MSQTMLTIALPLALAWMMYSVGLTLSLADFKRVAIFPEKILAGLLAQLIGLPLIAYTLIHTLALPEPVVIGLWLLALSPGGASSNMITYLSGGDSALSISMTAVSSLIIPISIPLMLPLVLHDTQLVMPIHMAILQLAAVTVIPVMIGMLMKQYIKSTWFFSFSVHVERSSVWVLFFTVVITLLANTQVFSQLFSIASSIVVALCLAGMLLGVIIAKILRGDKVLVKTLAIEIGIQNAGTAIFVAVVQLQRPELAITPLLYGVLMNIPAFLIIYHHKRQSTLVQS